MSIAEYQLYLKNLIDATTDETILKKWKTQMEADTEHKTDKKDDTSDYVVIESGLGIDE